jgi:hypothetical protein
VIIPSSALGFGLPHAVTLADFLGLTPFSLITSAQSDAVLKYQKQFWTQLEGSIVETVKGKHDESQTPKP